MFKIVRKNLAAYFQGFVVCAIAVPLLSFNIGLEAAQIVLVSVILLAGYLMVDKLNVERKWWVWALSAVTIVIAINIAQERWPL